MINFRRAAITFILLISSPSLIWANTLSGPSGTLGSQNFALNASMGYGERDMEADGGGSFTYASKRVMFQGLYGINHYVNVFGHVGFADEELKKGADFASPLSTYFGGGLRFSMLPREQTTQIHLDAQTGFFTAEDNGLESKNWEYRIAAYARMRQESTAFFGGLQYSDVQMDLEGLDAGADDVLGAFFGGEVFVNPNVFFNAELHIFDMQAIFLGVGYRL